MAAEYDHFDVARLLLQKRADINGFRRDTSGVHDTTHMIESCSVLALAQLWGNTAVTDLLSKLAQSRLGRKNLA
jgi:hypothetical protein